MVDILMTIIVAEIALAGLVCIAIIIKYGLFGK